MTMIAFGATADRAFVMTDSGAYDSGVNNLVLNSNKVKILHPLDTAITATGPCGFTTFAAAYFELVLVAGSTYGHPSTFDALVDVSPPLLRDVWEHYTDPDEDGDGREAAVALIGYSDTQERFTSYLLPKRDDFAPQLIDGLFVRPSSLTTPISAWEAQIMGERLLDEATEEERERGESFLHDWTQRKMNIPVTEADWRNIAIDVREDRSEGLFGSNIITAGNVYLTTLRRGITKTKCIHSYDDSEETWAVIRERMGLSEPDAPESDVGSAC
jgi:hypothetical protein